MANSDFAFSEAQLKDLYDAFVWQGDWMVTQPLSRALGSRGAPELKLRILMDVLKRSAWVLREIFDERSAAMSLGEL